MTTFIQLFFFLNALKRMSQPITQSKYQLKEGMQPQTAAKRTLGDLSSAVFLARYQHFLRMSLKSVQTFVLTNKKAHPSHHPPLNIRTCRPDPSGASWQGQTLLNEM